MMTRRSTGQWFFHALAATGFVVATVTVYAEETPLVSDDQ